MTASRSEPGKTLWKGFAASAVWLALCVGYVIWRADGWSKFYGMPPNEFGDFVAGVSAPIAFGWLIYGFFLQGKQLQLQRTELELQRQELKLQREEVARLANETAAQRKAIEANELHARRDVFMQLLSLVTDELNAKAIQILASIEGQNVDGQHLMLGVTNLRDRYARGERDAYFEALIRCCVDGNHKWLQGAVNKVMGGDDILRRICDLIEGVLEQADYADPTHELRKFFEFATIGTLYWLLIRVFGWESKLCFRAS